MGLIALEGNPPIPVILRRSTRAKRISLRLSSLDGRVTLTLPRFVPEAEGLAFLKEKEAWLRQHLAKQVNQVPVTIGSTLPVEGRELVLRQATGRKFYVEDDGLFVPGATDSIAHRTRSFLKTLARERLAGASDHYSGLLGKPYSRITLRDTRSRWGSCSSTGGLSYSWRLIFAPPDVLRYVAAHEVAHLAEMNHSDRFWRVVEDLYGPWKPQRDWLRENGPRLHAFRFDD